MKITCDSQLAVSDRVLFVDLIDEGAMMHVETEEYFTFNEIGAIVIKLLEEKSHSGREICSRVIEEYEVEPSNLEQDVLNYLQELVDLELVKVQ